MDQRRLSDKNRGVRRRTQDNWCPGANQVDGQRQSKEQCARATRYGLGPLTSKAGVAVPSAPTWDVREMLRTVSPPRTQSQESRLGTPNETVSQASMNASNLPTITPAPAGSSSATTAPAEEVLSTSVPLWNRPDPNAWVQYKTDMLATLNIYTLTSRADDRRMTDGNGPTVSGLYLISIVDWLLAEQEQFSSAIALRFVDLDGLPQDNTMGPLNTRSLMDVRRRAKELMPPLRKGKRVISPRRTSPIINTAVLQAAGLIAGRIFESISQSYLGERRWQEL